MTLPAAVELLVAELDRHRGVRFGPLVRRHEDGLWTGVLSARNPDAPGALLARFEFVSGGVDIRLWGGRPESMADRVPHRVEADPVAAARWMAASIKLGVPSDVNGEVGRFLGALAEYRPRPFGVGKKGRGRWRGWAGTTHTDDFVLGAWEWRPGEGFALRAARSLAALDDRPPHFEPDPVRVAAWLAAEFGLRRP